MPKAWYSRLVDMLLPLGGVLCNPMRQEHVRFFNNKTRDSRMNLLAAMIKNMRHFLPADGKRT
jgi:hypothetical protein